MTQSPTTHLAAIGYAILGFTVWVFSDSCIKYAGLAHVPVVQIMFMLSACHTLSLTTILAMQRKLGRLRMVNVRVELIRMALLFGSAISNIYMFTNVPLTTAYTAVFLSPMLISIMAALFLKEHLNLKQITLITMGFGGVVIAISPWSLHAESGSMSGYIAMPFSILFFSVGMLLLRISRKTETNESMAFFPHAIRSILLLPVFLWAYEPMSRNVTILLIFCGFFSCLGWLAINQAFRHAPAAVVSPFHYSQLITGSIIGYLVWNTIPAWHVWLGASIIIASGLTMAHMAHRAHRRTTMNTLDEVAP